MLPAGTAALLLATPLFGSTVVSAELLGLPFVLAGIAAALVSLGRADRTSSTWWAIAAGVAGAAAFLIKQNIVDVALFVAVMAAVSSRRGAGAGRAAGLRLVGGAAIGAVAMTAVVLGVAATRGTGPAGVWDAVVVFRAEAAGIIAQSDNPATGKRLGGVLVALVFSGAPLLAGVLAWTVGPGRAGTAVRRVAVRRVGAAGLGDVRGAGRRRLLAALPDGAGPRAGRAGRRVRARRAPGVPAGWSRRTPTRPARPWPSCAGSW